ncbi:MAG: hypothetical protein L6262_05280 [Weeksellaceae bacterium]|nr:hypothetical protein [Weeksellaceae bacterium]
MKNYIKIILLVFTFSCQKENKKVLEGKWIFVSNYNIPHYTLDGFEEPPLPPKNDLGFNFFSKDSCEANSIFYNLKSLDVDYYRESFGRKTVFKIDKDSLKIFDRSLNKWTRYKIMRLDENNLVLNYNDIQIKNYVKILKN